MLLVVCTDDDDLLEVARQTAGDQPGVYGACYQVFEDPVQPLGVQEDLFVSAHGAYAGDDHGPVIGDMEDALYLSPEDLFRNLSLGNVIPPGYAGRVFVSACEAADPGSAGYSFAALLSGWFQRRGFAAVRVFGESGTVGLRVPGPGDPCWWPVEVKGSETATPPTP